MEYHQRNAYAITISYHRPNPWCRAREREREKERETDRQTER